MANVVNVAIHDSFPFRDNTAALVSGKVNGDWEKVLVHDGVVDSSTTVTVSAVSGASGYYDSVFTPATTGRWQLFITVTHNGVVYPFASDIYDVIPAAADGAALATAIAGVQTTVDAIAVDINDIMLAIDNQGDTVTIRNGIIYREGNPA